MLQRLKSKIKYMSVAKKLSVLLCVILLGTVTAGSTYAYVVTGTPSLVNLFINGLSPDGNLIIEKNLEHPYGDQYELPEGLEFDFRVELGEEYAGETVKTTRGDKTADKDGTLNVTAAPGSRTTIYDIDNGTKAVVKEIKLGKGFTADQQEQEITVKKYRDNVLTFVNTYKPDKADTAKLTVNGRKTLEGRLWQEGDSFTFRMEAFEKGQWISLGEETVEYDKEDQDNDFEKFDFTEQIQQYGFTKQGTYSFRVTEVGGSIGGITYDKAESYFDVIVTDMDMDGALEISDVRSGSSNTIVDGTDVRISFNNKYAPSGSAKVSIEISKELNDTSGKERAPAGFSFELLDEDGEIITVSEMSNVAGDTSISLVFTPADAGRMFQYQLREKYSGETIDSMTYDDRVYDLEVTVRDDLDGTVSAVISEPGKDSDSDVFKAKFLNEYDPLNAYMTLNGEKRLEGRELMSGEFDFQLYQVKDDSYSLDGAKLMDTAVNDADGDFSFETQIYTKIGTYRYVIVEDSSDDIRGIIYDDTVYWVTVVVTDVKGQLHVDKTIVNDEGQNAAIVFNNEYEAEPVSWMLEGTKVLEDEDKTQLALSEGQFVFELYSTDADFVKQGEAFKTVKNSDSGQFVFDGIQFTEEGTYRYVIVEDAADDSDIEYDDSVYCVTVKVDDPGNGKLEITDVDILGDGTPVDEVQFTNVYVGREEPPTEPSEPDEPTQPDEPSKPSEPGKPSVPDGPDQPTTEFQPQDGLDEPVDKDKGTQTGDNFNMTLAVIMLFISAAVAAAAVALRRRDVR